MNAAERLARAFHVAYDIRADATLDSPYRQMSWEEAPQDYKTLMITAAQALIDAGVIVPNNL